MTNYTEYSIREDTRALICLVCARRVPHVPQKQNMSIKRIQLLSRVDQSESETVGCCGLTRKQTEHIFGLSTYVQKYGEMSDEIYLDENQEEFNYWHVEIPFDIASVTV